MEYNKIVSVVMPVHNGEKFLREAIESVLNQTYKNFEFLIIENCSTDSSLEIIKSYNDSRIRLIIEEYCGIVQGYNRGFKEAKGEFVVIHDQDDISIIHRIKSQLEYLISNNLDICGSSFQIVDEEGKYIKDILPPSKGAEIIERIFFDFFVLFNPTIMIRKELLVKVNYFDTQYPVGADYDFLLKCLIKYRSGNNSNILLKYRIHKNNTSSKNPKKGEKLVQQLAFTHFNNFAVRFKDRNYTLSRLHFFYGNYFLAAKFILKSIYTSGLNIEKVKYLSFSTIFVLPIFLVRKRGLFYNKVINRILDSIYKKK